MAIAMIEVLTEALIATGKMRRIEAIGMRSQLLLKLCQAYD